MAVICLDSVVRLAAKGCLTACSTTRKEENYCGTRVFEGDIVIQVADRAASFLGQCMPVPGVSGGLGAGKSSPLRRRASSMPVRKALVVCLYC